MDKIINSLIERYPLLHTVRNHITAVAEQLIELYKHDGVLFTAGNGGSAADAEHIVGELIKSFMTERKIPPTTAEQLRKLFPDGNELAEKLEMGFKAVSLNGHPSLSSAVLNDISGEMIFAQQLFALGSKGDMIIGISTSGNAGNILQAFKVAKIKGITTVLLTGKSGGRCLELADYSIVVPAQETYIIQEYHLPIYHALCAIVEDYFYGTKN